MSDNENSLGDQNTFDGGDDQFDPQSLGDQGTFARGGGDDPQSLGDEMTFGGGANDADDSFDDGMEVVDLEARYRIERTLGKGGMGEVLLATDTRLERKVAIKRILGTAARSKTAVSRFLTEAQSVAALNHPNIVQIYDYGRAKDGPFLIMEYVESESLLDKCRQGPLELEEAVNLTCQLCEGLAKAHAANIIHRDIKPANVLMTPDGMPKLTDFGLAKDDTADTGMTMAGAVLGTLDFMPPEQRKDAALTDNRSDLWSLAASLYQMVTGKSPKIIKFNDVPAALQDVLARALEDEKGDRYQTALEFRDALRECLSADGPDLSELDTGQCPSCGTKNDSSRRFCRNPDCGASLEAPCLSCGTEIPMWEGVCGSCGAKQEPLVQEAIERKQQERLDVEAALESLDFKRARQRCSVLSSETDPRLPQQVAWASAFHEEIESRYQLEIKRVAQLQSEALQHEKSTDYKAAIRALRQISETLIYEEIEGFDENVADNIERLQRVQRHCVKLERKINKSIQARKLEGLMPLVNELHGLMPQREDIEKLRGQLIERAERLQQVREESVAEARRLIDQQNYSAAVVVLKKVDKSLRDKEVQELWEESDYLDRRVKELDNEIEARVAADQLHQLLPVIEEYLLLRSDDTQRVQLRDKVIARDEKNARNVSELISRARIFRDKLQFTDALNTLRDIPTELQTEEDAFLAQECTYLERERHQAISVANKGLRADTLELLGHASNKIRAYESLLASSELGQDTSVLDLKNKVDKRRTQLVTQKKIADNAKKASKITGIVASAAGLVAVIFLIVLGVRSAMRSAAIAEARELKEWQTILSYDPDDPEALLGYAEDRLAGYQPQHEEILQDLDRLQGMAIDQKKVNRLIAQVYVLQSIELAKNDDVDAAEGKYNAAVRLGIEQNYVDRVKKTLALAYVRSAESAVDKGDIETAANDAAKALSYDDTIQLSDRIAMAAAELRVKNTVENYEVDSGDGNREAATNALVSLNDLDEQSQVLLTYRRRMTDVLERRCEIALKEGDYLTFSFDYGALAQLDSVLEEKYRKNLEDIPSSVLQLIPPSTRVKLPPIINSIGMKLKRIPPGKFMMGDEGTTHEVTLTKSFMIGVFEVTQEQYASVINESPNVTSQIPVTSISWEKANEFCAALSALPAEKSAGRSYRLPTEAEWEYSCRAGSKTEYCFGDDEIRLRQFGWFSDNATSVQPCGQKSPNQWGLYDMHGNAYEWCSDWYEIYPTGAVVDPTGPSEGTEHVYRGGNINSSATYCRSGYRYWRKIDGRAQSNGFRVVCTETIK